MQISSPSVDHASLQAISSDNRKPNFVIVGCQKSGTTWLHHALAKSRHFASSTPKEMHFFNKPESERDWEEYLTHFPDRPDARYVMESTPGYFQLPSEGHDTAASIRKFLDNPKLAVIFRNPVDRYESAYIHHVNKGHLPYVKTISGLRNDCQMLELGHYGSILRHWQAEFPDLGVFFYDDLEADNRRFIGAVMEFLGVENDIDWTAINFRRNSREEKTRSLPGSPELDAKTRAALRDYYREEIDLLQDLTGRDLSHWLRSGWPGRRHWRRTTKKLHKIRNAFLRRITA